MKITPHKILAFIGIIFSYFIFLHGFVLHYIFDINQIHEEKLCDICTDTIIEYSDLYYINVIALHGLIGLIIYLFVLLIMDLLFEGKDSMFWFEFTIPAFWKKKEDPLWDLYQQAGKAFAEGNDDLGNSILDKIEKLK